VGSVETMGSFWCFGGNDKDDSPCVDLILIFQRVDCDFPVG